MVHLPAVETQSIQQRSHNILIAARAEERATGSVTPRAKRTVTAPITMRGYETEVRLVNSDASWTIETPLHSKAKARIFMNLQEMKRRNTGKGGASEPTCIGNTQVGRMMLNLISEDHCT